jgi:hypothetical protein
MSFLSKIFKRKRRMSDEELDKIMSKPVGKVPEAAPPLQSAPPHESMAVASRIETDNLRMKLDLVMTELSSIKMQNQAILDKLASLEQDSKSQKPIRYY